MDSVTAIVDALRRGDEAMAVGLIDSVKGVAHLGKCLLRRRTVSWPRKEAKRMLACSSQG
jgi:hypothetical protein